MNKLTLILIVIGIFYLIYRKSSFIYVSDNIMPNYVKHFTIYMKPDVVNKFKLLDYLRFEDVCKQIKSLGINEMNYRSFKHKKSDLDKISDLINQKFNESRNDLTTMLNDIKTDENSAFSKYMNTQGLPLSYWKSLYNDYNNPNSKNYNLERASVANGVINSWNDYKVKVQKRLDLQLKYNI
jgi:hypothetical protein